MSEDEDNPTTMSVVADRPPLVVPAVKIEDYDDEVADMCFSPGEHPTPPASPGNVFLDEEIKMNSAARRWLLIRSHIYKKTLGYETVISPLSSGTQSPAEGPDDPTGLIALIQSGPSVQSYTRLKRQLKHCDRQWILRFLELRGLELLYVSLLRLSAPAVGRLGRRTLSIADAFAQVECVACFKAVMDSQAGLDYIIEDTEFTRKLANGESQTRIIFC